MTTVKLAIQCDSKPHASICDDVGYYMCYGIERHEAGMATISCQLGAINSQVLHLKSLDNRITLDVGDADGTAQILKHNHDEEAAGRTKLQWLVLC